MWWEKWHQLKVVVTNVSGDGCGVNVNVTEVHGNQYQGAEMLAQE